jgi:hypothetical protein
MIRWKPALALCAGALLAPQQLRAQQVSADEAREIARDAYVYAYPMVLEDVSIRQTTNFAEPTGIPGQGVARDREGLS